MPTQARTPADHYQESQRLLAAAESPGTDTGVATVAALAAVGHALLAAAPRRARKAEQRPGRHTSSPSDRWLYGDDQDGAQR